MDSFILCKITGVAILLAQAGCVAYSVAYSVPPADVVHGMAFWGVIIGLPFIWSK